VINTIRNWVHFQPTRWDNMHPTRPSFFSFGEGGGRGRCGWGCFAIWCFQMYTIWFLHVSHQVLNCSLLCSQFVPPVPNSSILYPISTFAQIPNYIGSPKKILHYVYFRSGNTYIIRPCVGYIWSILEVCQSGHWVFRIWWWTKQRGWLFPPPTPN
jgi:hypothetical protein